MIAIKNQTCTLVWGRFHGIIEGVMILSHLPMDSIPLALPMGTRVQTNDSHITQLIEISGIVGTFRYSSQESGRILNDSSFWSHL